MTAVRNFNLLYVWLDLGWLVLFAGLLLYFKKYQALLAGLAAGVVYMLVDYGIFFLALKTRVVTGADPSHPLRVLDPPGSKPEKNTGHRFW